MMWPGKMTLLKGKAKLVQSRFSTNIQRKKICLYKLFLPKHFDT